MIVRNHDLPIINLSKLPLTTRNNSSGTISSITYGKGMFFTIQTNSRVAF